MSLYLGNKKVAPIVYVKDSGETITAINKTGTTITTGQKVWLNENQQTEGSSYLIGTGDYYQNSKLGVIDRTGTFGYYYNGFYNIGAESAEYAGYAKQDVYLDYIMYMADNSMFSNGSYACRIDGQAQWSTSKYCVGDDLFVYDSNVYQLDMSNGTVINTFTFSSGGYIPDHPAKVGNYIYRLYGPNSNANYKFLIDYENLTLTSSSYTITNSPYTNDMYSIGVTKDNKYIIATLAGGAIGSPTSFLCIIEVLEDGNLRGLLQSEMPADMQKWYSTACGANFNPYTGVLCVQAYQGSDYGIYRYEGNGTWTQLPIDLGLPENALFCAPITVSDDITRACYSYYIEGAPSTSMSRIVNLTTTSGYAAIPYKFYNVTENTITGVAKESAESNQEIKVNIVGE